ncbi:winged helix DNA-binding protein [Roseicyclus sp. F158]|uniref:Winged helix DNA-binding protein n=1 Tax=Tropicimonas omnivorans TaxID=3075590 RepID=A0ABU3DJ55_9RHOB|nr:MarR family transcriptional regulator [Roseicyclus sp. F158]MDT0683564.1 winged helix DNA-binding protein [Roseicyclus sp. F158]
MYLDADATRERLRALSELETRLSFRVSRLSKLLDNHATRELAGKPLNLTGYRILMVLKIFRETSAAELSRLMVIDRAQVSRSVAELTGAGFLVERSDPTNKRRKLLRLSDKGKRELGSVRSKFEARQSLFEELLTEREMEGLYAAIDKLSRHLAREMDHPEALPTTGDGKEQ